MTMNIERILIPSTKGKIAVVINHPEIKTEKLAVLCSGFLDSKDYAHLAGLAEELNNEGYTVARFDAYGIWESEGMPSDYATSQYLADLKNVIDFMETQGNFTHLLLGGHSKGGFAALYQACIDPRVSAVLAIMSTFPFIKENNQATIEKWEKLGERVSHRNVPGTNEIKEIILPFSYVADRLQYDLLAKLPHLRAPLIMVAGSEDKLALVADVKALFNQAPEPKEFIMFEGVGHDYRKFPEQITLVDKRIIQTLKNMLLLRH